MGDDGQRVTKRIEEFRGRVSDETWATIGPLVRSWVTLAEPHTVYGANELAFTLTRHLEYCLAAGVAVDAAAVFDLDIIDHSVLRGQTGLSASGSKANYRTRLYRIREVVLGPVLAPPRPTPLRAADAAMPYTATEVVVFRGGAESQRTEAARHGCRVLTGLCFGAGLATEDLRVATGEGVRRHLGAVIVGVGGRRPREVPVMAPWEDTVLACADAVGRGRLFRPGRTGDTRNVVSTFLYRTSGGEHLPKFSTQRARATWICWHLANGTPPQILCQAAGVVGFEAFSRYLDYLPAVPEAEATAILRGGRG